VPRFKVVANRFQTTTSVENPPISATFFNPSAKLIIESSLFFDGNYAAGAVGPTGYSPATI
jgi:hypothetical protein